MNFLYRPVGIYSLVFFRIAFGILAFAEIVGVFGYYHLYKNVFEAGSFHFHYYGFEWVAPLPEPFMSLFFVSLLIAAFLIFIGKWYRWATAYYAIGFTWVFLLEKTQYLNHGYLLCWLSFVMIFLPADRYFSADAKKNPSIKRTTIPLWSLAILPFLMGIVYFFGGIAKINPDWLQAMPLLLWLEYKKDLWLIGPLISQDWVAWFMAYGGLILDLTAAFFMLGKRTRKWAFIAVIFFHFSNLLIFNIGIFPWLSVCLTALFFPPDFPVKIIDRLQKGTSRFARFISKQVIGRFPSRQEVVNTEIWQNAPKFKPFINLALALILLYHTAMPLRHHLFPGDVAWTEEGHRFSWRMMLRSKRGYGTFEIKNTLNDSTEQVKPLTYLTKRQNRNLYTHPDMIWEFAQYLEKEYKKRGWEPEIYANIFCKLNNNNYWRYVDKEVDLAKEEWQPYKRSKWILPALK